ncbi:MAG: lysophospholipid acyltransferase family protein [Anaeromyxobacter sp.]
MTGSAGRYPPEFDRQFWSGALVPLARALLRVGYFKLEVEGAEHLPRSGPVVYAQNHAGWFPLDAFFLALAVSDALGPQAAPVFAAYDRAVTAPVLGPFLRRAGAVPASWFRRPEHLPPEVRAVGIFPEGWPGNTKPFWEAYRMKPWNRGFVRVAAALDAPIVPVAVIGGEECLPVAWTVGLLKPLLGAAVGLPLSLLPLPARWKIVFHRPVRVEEGRAALTDHDGAQALSARIRGTVQATLDRESRERALGKLSHGVAALAGTGARSS